MDTCLEATRYCDANHPDIQSLARVLQEHNSTKKDLVVAAFQHVRDNVVFGFDRIKMPASETLNKGYGACYNKALLTCALMRALDIPAKFCSKPVRRAFMQPTMGWFHHLICDPFHHCFLQVNLSGKWIALDGTFDPKMYQTFFRPLGVSWSNQWDGENDMNVFIEHQTDEPVVHEDIDGDIDRNLGNTVVPWPLTDWVNDRLNQRMWKVAGVVHA